MKQSEAIRTIKKCVEIAHRGIHELHQRNPSNETFAQEGLLDGKNLIDDLLAHNEWGVALEHLLYMIHESDISFEMTLVLNLHTIAEQFGIHNHYTRSNLTKLGKLSTAFNVPLT